MSYIIDIIKGSKIKRTEAGISLMRRAYIDGITGDPDTIMLNALNDPRLPQFGDAHPADNSLRCLEISATPLSPSKYMIDLSYARPQGNNKPADESQAAEISVGSTTREYETDVDIHGNPLYVSFQYTLEVDSAGNPVPPRTIDQIKRARVAETYLSLTLKRKEPGDPSDKALEYNQRVNQSPFRGRPPRTWYCDGIHGVTRDDGETYEVTYRFLYNPKTWDFVATVIDPDTGFIPSGVSDGAGRLAYEVYEKADFNNLNLF